MKTTFATAALILATAGTSTFAQGMEGHQIGYSDKPANEAAYSTRSAQPDPILLKIANEGTLRAEDTSDNEITVYPTDEDDFADGEFSR